MSDRVLTERFRAEVVVEEGPQTGRALAEWKIVTFGDWRGTYQEALEDGGKLLEIAPQQGYPQAAVSIIKNYTMEERTDG